MGYMDFIRPLSAVIFCFVARNICDLKIPRLKFAVWVAAIYMLVGVTVFFNTIAGSAVLLISIAVMNYVNGNKIPSSIICALFAMIIMVICNSLSGLILSRVYSDIDYYSVVPDDWALFLKLLVLNFIFSHIISKTIGILLHKRYQIKNVGSVNRRIIMMFFMALLLVFSFVYITAISYNVAENPSLIIVYVGFFLFLLILTYFIFSTSLKENRLKNSQTELRQLEEYTENIESMYNDIRSIRHDYTNVIVSMAGYIEDDDMQGLKEYFEKDIIPFTSRMEKADNNIAALSKLKEPSLKGIIAVKLIRAQENNIRITVDIKEEIHIKSIDLLDLNRIMGILLDNAFEAAVDSQSPFIGVAFVKKGDGITIAIVNSKENNDISVSKIFNQGFSTKGRGRGYGLSNITSMLEKYPNVILDTQVNNREFEQVIHIEEGEGE